MSVFAFSIIAKSQCWLLSSGQIRGKYPYYGANIVFALICPYLPPYSTSGICAVVSQIIYFAVKVQGKMMHKDMHKIVFQ